MPLDPSTILRRLNKTLGVRGSELRNIEYVQSKEKLNEFETLVEDVKGHALTLQIMGGFLKRAFGGDIRQRDRVKFERADEKIDGGHAFRAMAAYAKWMEDGSDEARRELAILCCLGLFDRPATIDCMEALLQPPAIAGLTEPLVGAAPDDWQFSLDALNSAHLLALNRDPSGPLLTLDTHPHIREYFAKQLREQRCEAWRAAHERLYEHLCKHEEGAQPTLEDLQPLYQAVAHGCQADLQQRACDEVYFSRIKRGDEKYSTRRLGAISSDLGAVAFFFEQPWNRVSLSLTEADQGWILNEAAFRLRALVRLTETLEPMRAGMELAIKQQHWNNAARSAGNLSELGLVLGKVSTAVADAEESVTYADRSGDAFLRMASLTTQADALHQAGCRVEAETHFRKSEEMQQERQPVFPLLYSVQGFQYCDLLLATPERAAWQVLLQIQAGHSELGILADVLQRINTILKWQTQGDSLLDIALDHLTLGRVALYSAILDSPKAHFSTGISELDAAVAGLRRSGEMDELPRGLLTRAWMRFLDSKPTGPSSAQEDLDEAWEIAERGPMRLFMADIHLYRARLFYREAN